MKVLAQAGAAESREVVSSSLERELEEQHLQAIQKLAYQIWQSRGCPEGSSENDWLEAEHKLVQRLAPAGRN